MKNLKTTKERTMKTRTEKKYGGLEVGNKVTYAGYPGVVTVLCEWSDTLIEVELVRGSGLCTDADEVILIEQHFELHEGTDGSGVVDEATKKL